MKLPSLEAAIVPRAKVEDYLLNLEHPIGGGKAKFFMRFGFTRERWQTLAAALRQHAHSNEVTQELADDEGRVFVIEGELSAPDGRRPQLRAIWLLELGHLAPRFITAYPLRHDR